MSYEKTELEQLKNRYLQALEYEKTYLTDSPEGKKWAEQEILKIIQKLNEICDGMTETEREMEFREVMH